MLKKSIFLLSSVFIFSCSDTKNVQENQELPKKDSVETPVAKTKKLSWRDSVINLYISETQQTLLKAIEQEKNSNLTIITDFEERNGVKYIVSQIGRTLDDKFTPETWLYIDSLSGNSYTYDIPNDTLILWKH